jgi:polyhydroxyalkanoate synthesis regulator phasin
MGASENQTSADPQPKPIPANLTDRVLLALEDTARTNATLAGRVDHLEGRVEDLEEEIKDQMGTMNAHLDNIAREAAKTNLLMEAEQKHRMEKEEKEETALVLAKKAELDAQKDRRKMLTRAASALWDTFKTPLATLATGVVAWLIYWYFWVPA